MNIDRPEVGETNGRPDGWKPQPISRSVYWTEPGLKIVRLRLISDPGFPVWDVSYCEGMIAGELVDVRCPSINYLKRIG